MKNQASFLPVTGVNLFRTKWEKWNWENEEKYKKMGSWLFLMDFDNWNPFTIT